MSLIAVDDTRLGRAQAFSGTDWIFLGGKCSYTTTEVPASRPTRWMNPTYVSRIALQRGTVRCLIAVILRLRPVCILIKFISRGLLA